MRDPSVIHGRAAPSEQDHLPLDELRTNNDVVIELLEIALGISLAGGIYPILVCVGVAAIASGTLVCQLIYGTEVAPGIGELIVLPTVFAVVCGVIGFVWAGIITLFVLPICYLVAKSLQLLSRPIWFGAICGGLVGMIAVAPVLTDGMNFTSVQSPLLVLAIGPGLTTVLGQAGGAWGGRRAPRLRASRVEWEKHWSTGGWSESNADGRCKNVGRNSKPCPHALQFRIRHLLWISVWLSVLLTAMRLVGIPLEIALPSMGVWIAFQAFTLFLGGRIVRWNLRRVGSS